MSIPLTFPFTIPKPTPFPIPTLKHGKPLTDWATEKGYGKGLTNLTWNA